MCMNGMNNFKLVDEGITEARFRRRHEGGARDG